MDTSPEKLLTGCSSPKQAILLIPCRERWGDLRKKGSYGASREWVSQVSVPQGSVWVRDHPEGRLQKRLEERRKSFRLCGLKRGRKEIRQILPAMPSNEGIFQWVPWLENIYSLTTERQAEP